jgi:hypothetical protein
LAVGGFGYYRTHMKMRQLEAEIKADEAKQAPAQAAPLPQSSPPSTPDSVIAPDTVTFLSGNKAAENEAKTHKAQVVHTDLVIASQPDGVKVEIDGTSDPKWVTPFHTTHLSPGAHTLVYSKDGFVTQSRTVGVFGGRNVALPVTLVAVSKVAVTSNPSGASIFVDGKDTGAVTPAQLVVEKGSHHITVRKQGYKDVSTDATVTEGQTASFAPVMLSQTLPAEGGPSPNIFNRFFGTDAIPDGKGLVHIRTVPKGATIIVNGRVAPEKTNARWPADPGVYSIVLQMDGYKSVHRNIKVEQGKIKNLDEIFERQ